MEEAEEKARKAAEAAKEEEEREAQRQAELEKVREGDTLICAFDYEAIEKEDLELTAGDKIVVLRIDESGWWTGNLYNNNFEANSYLNV